MYGCLVSNRDLAKLSISSFLKSTNGRFIPLFDIGVDSSNGHSMKKFLSGMPDQQTPVSFPAKFPIQAYGYNSVITVEIVSNLSGGNFTAGCCDLEHTVWLI